MLAKVKAVSGLLVMAFRFRDLCAPLAALFFLSGCASDSSPAVASASPRGDAAAAASRPGLATGFGERRDSRVRRVDFVRESLSRPYLLATLHYNDREGVAAAGAQPGGGPLRPKNLVSIDLRDAQNRPFRIYQRGIYSREPYVIGRKGERYSIALRNDSDARLEFVVSVDGLDVLDGKPAAVTKGGYLLEPGQSMRVEGWRTSLNSVAAFRFGGVADSYAEKKFGDARNVGVIGVAIFEERGSDPKPRLRQEAKQRRRADPFPNRGGFAEPPVGR